MIPLVTRFCIIHKQIKKFRWALSCAYAKFVFNFELYSYQKKMKWKCLNFKQSYHQKRREKLTNRKSTFGLKLVIHVVATLFKMCVKGCLKMLFSWNHFVVDALACLIKIKQNCTYLRIKKMLSTRKPIIKLC